jgi:hypothetical protein
MDRSTFFTVSRQRDCGETAAETFVYERPEEMVECTASLRKAVSGRDNRTVAFLVGQGAAE